MERFVSYIESFLVWLIHLLLRPEIKVPPKPIAKAIAHSLEESSLGEPVSIPATWLQKSVHILGSSGYGKSNLLLNLFGQDLEEGRQGIVICDLRGDLVNRALEICQATGVDPNRIVLLDLREQEWIVSFDPLSGPGAPHIKALHLLEVIRSEADSWGVQIDEVARNSFLLLSSTGHPVTDIERLLFDIPFLDALLSQCDDQTLVSFFGRYKALSEEKRLTWAQPVLNKLSPIFATKGFRALLGGSNPICIDTILSKPGSILLCSLSVDETYRSGRMLGTLLIAAIARVMFSRVNVAENSRAPVRLYVDEFEHMAAASETFEGLICEGRRFKFTLIVGHQHFRQLSTKLKSSIRNNVGLQAIFCVGHEDARELMWELPEGFGVDRLTSLKPGQMLLVPRGGDAQFVQCALAPTNANREAVADYRLEILKRTGSPLAEVLNQLDKQQENSVALRSRRKPWELNGGGACN